jgi:nitrate reductase gamma subunit
MSEHETGWSVSAPASRTNPQNAKSDEKVWNPVKVRWEAGTVSSDGKFIPADPAKAAAEEASMDRIGTILFCAGVAAALWFVAWFLTPQNDSIMAQVAAIEHGYLAVIAGGVLVVATIAVMRERKK